MKGDGRDGGAAPSPADLGPNRVEELQRVYDAAREGHAAGSDGTAADADGAHRAGLRAIALDLVRHDGGTPGRGPLDHAVAAFVREGSRRMRAGEDLPPWIVDATLALWRATGGPEAVGDAVRAYRDARAAGGGPELDDAGAAKVSEAGRLMAGAVAEGPRSGPDPRAADEAAFWRADAAKRLDHGRQNLATHLRHGEGALADVRRAELRDALASVEAARSGAPGDAAYDLENEERRARAALRDADGARLAGVASEPPEGGFGAVAPAVTFSRGREKGVREAVAALDAMIGDPSCTAGARTRLTRLRARIAALAEEGGGDG